MMFATSLTGACKKVVCDMSKNKKRHELVICRMQAILLESCVCVCVFVVVPIHMWGKTANSSKKSEGEGKERRGKEIGGREEEEGGRNSNDGKNSSLFFISLAAAGSLGGSKARRLGPDFFFARSEG